MNNNNKIFMRGDPLKDDTLIYIIGINTNTIYYLSENVDRIQASNGYIPNVIMDSRPYTNLSLTELEVTRTNTASKNFNSGFYSFKSSSDNSYLQWSGNALDCIPGFFNCQLVSVENNSTAYNIQAAYPGIPYFITCSYDGQAKPCYFYTNLNGIAALAQFYVYLIPVNLDSKLASYSYMQGTSMCRAFQGETIGLDWFLSWFTGGSTCKIGLTTPEEDNNCYFNNLDSCKAMYLYDLCPVPTEENPDIGNCGNCLGQTSSQDKVCVLANGRSNPPMKEVDREDDDHTSVNNYIWIIVAIVIFIVLIILLVLLFK